MSDGMFSITRSLPLLVTLAAVTLAHANNFVENPGFEAGQKGWLVPTTQEYANHPWDIAEEDPHSGGACASLTSEEPGRYAIGAEQTHKVLQGERYRIEAWVKFSKDARLEGDFPVAYIRATLTEASRLDISDPLGHIHVGLLGGVARSPSVGKLGVPELPSGWRKIEAVIEIPPDAAFLQLNLFVHGVVGTVFWDDVSFESVDAGTPLSKILE